MARLWVIMWMFTHKSRMEKLKRVYCLLRCTMYDFCIGILFASLLTILTALLIAAVFPVEMPKTLREAEQ